MLCKVLFLKGGYPGNTPFFTIGKRRDLIYIIHLEKNNLDLSIISRISSNSAGRMHKAQEKNNNSTNFFHYRQIKSNYLYQA